MLLGWLYFLLGWNLHILPKFSLIPLLPLSLPIVVFLLNGFFMSQHSKVQLVQNAAVHLLTWKQENNTPDWFSLASLLSLSSPVRSSSLQKLSLLLSLKSKKLCQHIFLLAQSRFSSLSFIFQHKLINTIRAATITSMLLKLLSLLSPTTTEPS